MAPWKWQLKEGEGGQHQERRDGTHAVRQDGVGGSAGGLREQRPHTLQLLARVFPEARHRRVDAGLQLHEGVDAVQRHLHLLL